MDDDYFDMMDEQGAWEASLSAEAEAQAEADAFEALQRRVAELQTQNAALIEACQAAERLCLLGPFDSGADLEADRLHVWGLCAGALELVGVAQNDAPEPEPGKETRP